MAIMIPNEITYFDSKSRENEMYESLQKLSDDFYVFHSYHVIEKLQGKINENEIDFLIFNPYYGCLIVEAKSGKVTRNNDGNWYYSSGVKMQDPFDQASTSMHNLINKFRDLTNGKYEDRKLLNRCKFMFCIWLVGYNKEEVNNAKFGPNVDKDLILTSDDLKDPTESITRIMKNYQKIHVIFETKKVIDYGGTYKHSLNYEEAKLFLDRYLCPSFDIVKNKRKEIQDVFYSQLLKEQANVLLFLNEQKTAAINGASGTGKTLIALERARRVASKENKVLFLCYNKNLQYYLSTKYPIDYVDFYTLDAFAVQKSGSTDINYCDLYNVVKKEIETKRFIYNHIIIDEAQDFSKATSNVDVDLIGLFCNYAKNKDNCSCFVFYDKNQLVNSQFLPESINEIDSKITLYQNCRNTRSVAETAYSLIKLNVDVMNKGFEGEKPEFIFCESKGNLLKKLNELLDSLNTNQHFSTVLLTLNGVETSILSNVVNRTKTQYVTKNYTSCPFYSSKTFKGLEADNVILVDLSSKSFLENDFNFYVAASRARKSLFVFVLMDQQEISDIIDNNFPTQYKLKDPRKTLALAMHGIAKI